jgi:hypothetical protein
MRRGIAEPPCEAALALACSGCSFLFVKGPPDHPASHRVVACTTSRTAPAIDVIIGGSRDGHVASVVVTPPFADTATGGCIANALRAADVPPFDGEDVTVKKQFEVAGP